MLVTKGTQHAPTWLDDWTVSPLTGESCYSEIAAAMNVTPHRVQVIERNAIAKIGVKLAKMLGLEADQVADVRARAAEWLATVAAQRRAKAGRRAAVQAGATLAVASDS